MTITAVIAALYVVATVALPFVIWTSSITFSLHHLAVLISVISYITLGVFITNIWSPYGIVDMIVGTLQTLLMLSISYYLAKHVKSIVARLASTVVDTLMMWVIAAELYYIAKTPFWATYAWTALGEWCFSYRSNYCYIISQRLI